MDKKDLKIIITAGLILAAGVIGWISCANFYEWREDRKECEAQAAKIEQAWCDDNNNLIK